MQGESLLGVEHLHHGLAYGLERVAVDVLHVDADDVPRGAERAQRAVGFQLPDAFKQSCAFCYEFLIPLRGHTIIKLKVPI